MSPKLFMACLLPFAGLGVVLAAGWVIESGLELPAAVLATLGVIPFINHLE